MRLGRNLDRRRPKKSTRLLDGFSDQSATETLPARIGINDNALDFSELASLTGRLKAEVTQQCPGLGSNQMSRFFILAIQVRVYALLLNYKDLRPQRQHGI
ncbi:MAG: hypothetical protein QOD89_2593 [Bradyrhizobium sp.]|nr:hypothetical protein [Bradyrhizobium sp.]